MRRNLFITFEGIDGSGKSSLSKLVYQALLERGIEGVHTCEPTDSFLGKSIREIVLHSQEKLSSSQQTLLFTADRISHVDWMKKQLETKRFVICDRYVHSTLAYQGVDVKTFETVYTIHELYLKDFNPDVVFLLDIDPIISLSRLEDDKRDNFEKVEFLRDVRKRYLKMAKEETDVFIVLDGNLPINQLKMSVLDTLLDRFF